MLPSTTIYPCKSPSHQAWLEALKMLILHQHLPAPFTNYWPTPVTDTQGVQAGSDIKEGKALMTHHVYSWTAACQNASLFPPQTCSLAPKTSSALVFWRQKGLSGWLCARLPLDTSQKRQGNTALTFACPNSGLLYSEKMTLPSLNFIYPLTSRNIPSPHLRRDRERAVLNCLLFPSWEEAVFLQYTQNK